MPAGKGYGSRKSIDSGPMSQGGGIRPPGRMAKQANRSKMKRGMKKKSMTMRKRSKR